MFTDWVINLRPHCFRIWQTLQNEDGQDLVEYAAVIVLIVLALASGMHTLANAINNAMTNVGTYINSVIG